MKSEPSRTFIGSVVCVDLVGYSLRANADQTTVKSGFNRLLVQVLQDVPAAERIILDTGDGAAVTFLGDPDECLNVALEMRDAMNAAAEELGTQPGEGPVRIGISLGPLRLAVDLNNRPNIVGDGLNVAGLIASFAQPGQIAVSRAFHDMVSRLSPEHEAMFRFEGKHVDRNAREHQVYVVEDRRRVPRAAGAAATAFAPPPPPLADIAPGSSVQIGWRIATAAVLLLAILVGAAWVLVREITAPRVASAPPETPPPVASPAPVVVPVAPAIAPPKLAPAPAPAPEIVIPAQPAIPSPPTPVESPPVVAASPKAPSPKVAPQGAIPAQAGTQSPPPPSYAPIPQPAAAQLPVTPIRREPVSYPRAALAQGISSGVVRARLAVDAAGRVTDVRILSSEPPRVFDREAARALKEWLFNAGAPQRSYEVEIEFKP